ncbi:MAG: hypothetical protein AAFV29_01390 [Myxococcota bacterium]
MLLAAFLAAAGLFLRQYTNDQREVWLVNSSPETAVIHLDTQRWTLLAGELKAVTSPLDPEFVLRISAPSTRHVQTVHRRPAEREVLIVEVAPAAMYWVADMSPRFAAHGTPIRRRLNADDRSFRPDVVQQATSAHLVRLRGGVAATIGPLQRLPKDVWLTRRYGRPVYKIFRVAPKTDPRSFVVDVERALAEKTPLVTLELPVIATSSTALR